MATSDLTTDVWPRGRLLLGLGAVAIAALVVLGGFVLTVIALVAPESPGPGPTDVRHPPLAGDEARDAIAASPMPTIPREAAWPHAPAAVPPLEIVVPSAGSIGAAGVASGFPRTPDGALAQLAAIEVRVLEAMNLPVLTAVHRAWVSPDGPDLTEWEMTANVQAFLGAVPHEEPDRIDDVTTVTVIPVGAQVKGTDGSDWVLACVMVEVRVTVVSDARMAYGHCSRMAWDGGRWMVGPGIAPASVSGAWPGTRAFIDAGWRTWHETAS